jgi:hypothetical protein
MKKHERDLFYKQMDDILPFISEENQGRLLFIRTFLEERFQVEDFENSFIRFDGEMGTKSIVYLLFAMILEYDSLKIS